MIFTTVINTIFFLIKSKRRFMNIFVFPSPWSVRIFKTKWIITGRSLNDNLTASPSLIQYQLSLQSVGCLWIRWNIFTVRSSTFIGFYFANATIVRVLDAHDCPFREIKKKTLDIPFRGRVLAIISNCMLKNYRSRLWCHDYDNVIDRRPRSIVRKINTYLKRQRISGGKYNGGK